LEQSIFWVALPSIVYTTNSRVVRFLSKVFTSATFLRPYCSDAQKCYYLHIKFYQKLNTIFKVHWNLTHTPEKILLRYKNLNNISPGSLATTYTQSYSYFTEIRVLITRFMVQVTGRHPKTPNVLPHHERCACWMLSRDHDIKTTPGYFQCSSRDNSVLNLTLLLNSYEIITGVLIPFISLNSCIFLALFTFFLLRTFSFIKLSVGKFS